MAALDEEELQGWKVLTVTFSRKAGPAAVLLGMSCLAVAAGCGSLAIYAQRKTGVVPLLAVLPALVGGVLWFQLTAGLFYRLSLVLKRPRARPVPAPTGRVEGRGLRCASCGHRIAPAWRRCPFCRGLTGTPRDARSLQADARLELLRSAGLGASLSLALGAMVLGADQPELGLAVALLGGVVLVAHLVAPWHLGGWVAAFTAWCLVAVGAVLWLAPGGWTVALALPPLAVAGWMGLRWRSVWTRLEGLEPMAPRPALPPWSPCAVCGSREAELVAPVVCVSVLFLTVRWAARSLALCRRHARRRALGAVLLSALVGWWGFPHGPLWTAEALAADLGRGGVTQGSELERRLRREEERQEAAPEGSTALEFVLGFAVGLALLGGALQLR